MKTGEILGLAVALNEVSGSGVSLHNKFRYALSINAKRVAPVAEAYDLARVAALKEYAKKDDAGEPARDQDHPERILLSDPLAFAKAHQELLDEEVEIALHKVDLDFVPDISGIAFAAPRTPQSVFNDLLPMIREPE